MSNMSQSSRQARHPYMRAVFGAACLLAVSAAAAAAQNPAAGRLWAAQTGPNQVSLAWDPVPGTKEYRIHLGDPSAPGTFMRQPVSRLSASARGGHLSGLQRVANGIMLVAVDAGGRVLQQTEFNRIAPATAYPPATPPAGVAAQPTGATEITVAWDAVPGATAYFIGRAVSRSGFSVLCALCSTASTYVDRSVMAGLPHTYMVSAIFPSGDISTRVISAPVTPGASAASTTPVYTPPGQPAGTIPTTTTPVYTPPGQPAGTVPSATTPVYTPPGQPAGTMPTATAPTPTAPAPVTASATVPTTTTSPVSTLLRGLVGSLNNAAGILGTATTTTVTPTVHQSTPVTGSTTSSTTTTSNPGTVLGGLAGGNTAGTLVSAGVAAPTSVTATVTGPAAVSVTWQPSATTGLTGYVVNRVLNGGAPEVLNTVSATAQSYTDAFFPATLFAAGPVRVTYGVVATTSSAFRGALSNEVTVQPPAPTPTPGGGSVASCRLDYQRADNMWAAFGRPAGALGPESISLSAGQNKAFITDWKYEKQRNDGTNYFGSHLRIAANPTLSTIRLHLRSLTLTGLAVFARTGNDTFWIRMDPNTSKQFQADLMEVFCEN